MLRFVGQRLTTTTQTATNSVYVQIELNGLARFGTSPLDLLRRSVPGYRQDERPDGVAARSQRRLLPGILVVRVEIRMPLFRLVRRLAALSGVLVAAAALAQAPTPAQPPRSATPGTPRAAAPDRTLLLDRVVAIVNDEAVTQYEIDEQKKTVLAQMKSQNVAAPAADVLDKQVLERLITERALLQFAKENGVRVDDTQVERTIRASRRTTSSRPTSSARR